MSKENNASDLDLDNVLNYTHNKRLDLVEALAPIIRNEDPKVIGHYLKALGDMDKAAMGKRRLGIEEAAQESNEAEARASADLLRAMKRDMFALPLGEAPRREAPTLGAEVPRPDLVPGETNIGVETMTYDGFKKQMQDNHVEKD
jgi:hypothetical protein